jgi:hypothetical protein
MAGCQFFSNGNGHGISQKIEILLGRIIELIIPEHSVTEDIDTKEIERLPNRFIELCHKLNDRCGRLHPGDFLYLEIGFLGKASPIRGHLEVCFSGNLIDGRIERLNGGMDRQLDADKDAHAKDNPHQGEDSSHFIDTKVPEGDLSEEIKESHK